MTTEAQFAATLKDLPLEQKADGLRIKADWLEEQARGDEAAKERERANLIDTIDERIAAFVLFADHLSATHWQRMGYTHTVPPIHEAEYISDKWVRTVKLEMIGGKRQRTSAHAFIARQDNYTRELGHVKAGDIHKPASFKKPAKHARGSVFAVDFSRFMTEYGPVYLR